jgi:hypothetical protein
MKKLYLRFVLALGLVVASLAFPAPTEAGFCWPCYDSCANLAWACGFDGAGDEECWKSVTDCYAFCDTLSC